MSVKKNPNADNPDKFIGGRDEADALIRSIRASLAKRGIDLPVIDVTPQSPVPLDLAEDGDVIGIADGSEYKPTE